MFRQKAKKQQKENGSDSDLLLVQLAIANIYSVIH